MSDTLLSNSDLAGVYSLPPTRRGEIERSARQLHLKQAHLEIAPGQMADAVLDQLGRVLHFPAWYGANFDALHDCLTDPECLPGKGRVLIISGGNDLRTCDPEGFAILLEVFAAAADERRTTGSPLWVLLDTPAHGIDTFPAT